ncbi:cyclic nucleotide-binding domain-containing protein [Floridanema evergladense]|uniref:Cyclic nucleotide-binding domain-containing protein n=1 Tax=Floridaenema evergladense BLCC-F167 TaxID=3153639 RepID=A0ABV4WST6_9CYAN
MNLGSTLSEKAICPEPLQPSSPISQENQNQELVKECSDWLSFHRIWGKLKDETLQAIAQCFQLLKIEPSTAIYEESQTPVGVYLLKWGSVEIYRLSLIGKSHIKYRSAGELFGYVPLIGDSENGTYQASAIAISKSEILFLSRSDFEQLLSKYPEIQGTINSFLAQDLKEFAQRTTKEQLRISGLQPYLHSIPQEEEILGSSKATQKLKKQIENAAKNLKPVVFQAAPGTGKTFLASLIHAHSGLANHPFAEIDCATLSQTETGELNTDPLFGKTGKCLGVLELLERGTLLISNVQILSKVDSDRLIDYLKTGLLVSNSADKNLESQAIQSWVRLILASPNKLNLPEVEVNEIKLFTLQQRKADIPEFADYFLLKFSQEQCRPKLEIDRADLRRLISYNYPGNLTELAAILKRAITMTPKEQTTIPEQVLWSVQSDTNTFRIDLLNQWPWLRKFLLSRWYPAAIWVVMMVIFVPVTIAGFISPQDRSSNIILNLFWAWWWPVYLFLFPFVGRLWCAVCPFMITGELIRRLSLWIFPRKLLPWPTKWLNRWGAYVLFAGFVIIYLWEKLWDLPHTAYLSAWLLIAITAGAVIGSLIYERRLWCRYLCPIGGMNGMFAKLAIVELRSTQQVCGSQCSTFGCFKGSPATPVNFPDALPTEGQETEGCPLYSHPAQLQDNRDCVLCMTCLKACPNRSVQLNLRFPTADLLAQHQGFWAEVALLLLLLGGACMHHADKILSLVGLGDLAIDSEHLLIALPVVILLLSIPAILTYLTHAIARVFDSRLPNYLTVIYAYLPFTLGTNLTHYIPSGITEAGQILPVLARTLGYSGNGLPTLTWSPDVAAFLQGVILLSSLAFSAYFLMRITQGSWLSNLPHLLLLTAMTIACFWLMV